MFWYKAAPASCGNGATTAKAEGVCNLADFLNRRTGWLLFHPDKAKSMKDECQKFILENSGLPEAYLKKEELKFEDSLKKMLDWA